MSTITITLSSANLGNDATESDFDAWAGYVAEHIDEALSIDAEVEQGRFGDAGDDVVRGGTEEQREAICGWLAHDGWDAFCSEPVAA